MGYLPGRFHGGDRQRARGDCVMSLRLAEVGVEANLGFLT